MEHRAGFWIRFIANIIDSIILVVVQFVISLLIGDFVDAEVTIELILTFLYFVLFHALNNGQTIGKKITGIRVVSLEGGQVTIGKMIVREVFGKIISSLILLIGFLIAAGKSKRALHDYIAKTIVIRSE